MVKNEERGVEAEVAARKLESWQNARTFIIEALGVPR
jgi:hypothetical protein